jgi:hypothetical protein
LPLKVMSAEAPATSAATRDEQRGLGVGVVHEELLDHEGVVLEVGDAHQEGEGAGAAGEAGGLGVEEERAAHVDARERGVEPQRGERLAAGREGALHRDRAVLRRRVEPGARAVQGAVLGLRRREGPRRGVVEEGDVGPDGGPREAPAAALELHPQRIEDRLLGGGGGGLDGRHGRGLRGRRRRGGAGGEAGELALEVHRRRGGEGRRRYTPAPTGGATGGAPWCSEEPGR